MTNSGSTGDAYFISAVRQQLYAKYGQQMVDGGGLRVTTTLDPTMQAEAYNAVYGTNPDALNPAAGRALRCAGLDRQQRSGQGPGRRPELRHVHGRPGSRQEPEAGAAGRPARPSRPSCWPNCIKDGYSVDVGLSGPARGGTSRTATPTVPRGTSPTSSTRARAPT